MEDDGGYGLLDYMRSDEGPELGRTVAGFGAVALLLFLVLYEVLFPGHGLPVISDVVPLVIGVMDSSIWFFVLGIMLGFFSLLANILFKAVQD